MAPATTISHAMSNYEVRKATFLQKETATAGPSRKKATSAASANKTIWPHQNPSRSRANGRDSSGDDSSSNNGGSNSSNHTQKGGLSATEYPSPRSMATLGLYFDPTAEEPDRCSVYPEGTSVSNWRPGQTALERLEEEDVTLSLLIVEKSSRASKLCQRSVTDELLWTGEVQHLLPTSKALNEARHRTYDGAWPLDGKKGWKPTSKKLSAAGFHFSPNEDENDCVTCSYCQCSLGGWEKGDDPVKEHQKRRPDCPIFISTIEKVEKKIEVKGSKKTSTTGAKTRVASRKRQAEEKNKEEDGGMEGVAEDKENVQRPGKKQATTPKRDASPPPAAVEEALAEEIEDHPPPLPKPAKEKKATTTKAATKTKKGTAKRKAAAESNDEQTIGEGSIMKKKRGGKKAATTADSSEAPAREAAPPQQAEQAGTADVEASDFEEEPSRQQPSSSSKGLPLPAGDTLDGDVRSTARVETFKMPKQSLSRRGTTEKMPKATTPPALPSPQKEEKPGKGDIAPLDKLDSLTTVERAMTVEEWLKMHVTRACVDMEAEGQTRIAKLRDRMDQGRKQAECILRGIEVNTAI